MYEAIGQAVIFAQTFEVLIVVCTEMVRLSKEFLEGRPTDFMVNPARLKEATKRLINELAKDNDITPDLESRISDLIDKRHTLIHRWSIENGWPADNDLDEIQRIIDLAKEITRESAAISQILTKYILRNNAEQSDMRIKLASIFKEADIFDELNSIS